MGCPKLWPDTEIEIARPRLFIPGVQPVRRRRILPFAPRMAISLAQSVVTQSYGSAVGIMQATFGSATTTGSLLVATVIYSGGFVPGTVTDSNGNTYTQAVHVNFASVGGVAIFYKENSTGGSSNQVSVPVAIGAFGSGAVAIAEFSGVATASSSDGTPASTTGTNNTTTPTTPSITTSASGSLVIGVFIDVDGGANTYTAGSGYTNLYASSNIDGTFGGAAEYQVVGGAGAYAPDWSLSGGTHNCFALCVAAFKAAAGGVAAPITGYEDGISTMIEHYW